MEPSQGGPHNHTIAGLCVALKQAMTAEFKDYQRQVVANAQALCGRLQSHGYSVVSGGTENHLILVDLKPAGIDGSRVQQVLDEVRLVLSHPSSCNALFTHRFVNSPSHLAQHQ
jgi:glycine hydroxymethyltransferase